MTTNNPIGDDELRQISHDAVAKTLDSPKPYRLSGLQKMFCFLIILLVALNTVFNAVSEIQLHNETNQNKQAIAVINSFHDENIQDKKQLACAIAYLAGPDNPIYQPIIAKFGPCPTPANIFTLPSPAPTPSTISSAAPKVSSSPSKPKAAQTTPAAVAPKTVTKTATAPQATVTAPRATVTTTTAPPLVNLSPVTSGLCQLLPLTC